MQENPLINLFLDLGLTEHESRVYFASLALGPATILKIAAAAEVKRTTVYSVVESLKQKGLLNIEVRGLKKLFAAENPEKLEQVLEMKKLKLKNTLPELASLYNLKGGESLIKYYQGLTGIKSVYEDLLKDIKPHQDYLVLTDQEQWLKQDKEFFMDFSERRAKKPINLKMLMQNSETAQQFKKYEKNYNAKIKILPPGTSLTTNLVIIPNRVVIHQLIPPILAIVIENNSVVQMHKETFEILWNSLP